MLTLLVDRVGDLQSCDLAGFSKPPGGGDDEFDRHGPSGRRLF
jgi:hypothetical protein